MEADSSLIRTNRIVELYTIANVGLNLALVIYPRHTECEDTVGFNHSLYNFCFLKFGVLIIYIFHRQQHFANCL